MTITAEVHSTARVEAMLRISTSGTAYERGRQQAKQCGELARPWLEALVGRIALRIGASSPAEAVRRVQPEVRRWRRQLRNAFAEGEEECCGIADGLGMDCGTYFAATFGYDRLLGTPSACTTVGFVEEGGRVVLGKTDDVSQDELGLNILEVASPAAGHQWVGIHFAGTVWTFAGINERGLTAVLTGLPGRQEEQYGVPSLVGAHPILPGCARVREAVELLRHLKLNSGGYSVLIADAQGEMALVEKTAVGTVLLNRHEGGFFAHTNHFLADDFGRKNPAQQEPLKENGVRRYENIVSLVRQIERSGQSMRDLLTDRSPRGAIWQQGEDGLHTDYAAMLVPAEARVVLWTGRPGSITESTLTLPFAHA